MGQLSSFELNESENTRGQSEGGTGVGVNVGVVDGVMVGDDVGVASAVWVAKTMAAISVERVKYRS
jgi:hypothetical protein